LPSEQPNLLSGSLGREFRVVPAQARAQTAWFRGWPAHRERTGRPASNRRARSGTAGRPAAPPRCGRPNPPALVLSSPRSRAAAARRSCRAEPWTRSPRTSPMGLRRLRRPDHGPDPRAGSGVGRCGRTRAPGGETADEKSARGRPRCSIGSAPRWPVGDVIPGGATGTSAGSWCRGPGSHAVDAGVHFGLDAAGIAALGDERGVPQIHQLNLPAIGV